MQCINKSYHYIHAWMTNCDTSALAGRIHMNNTKRFFKLAEPVKLVRVWKVGRGGEGGGGEL